MVLRLVYNRFRNDSKNFLKKLQEILKDFCLFQHVMSAATDDRLTLIDQVVFPRIVRLKRMTEQRKPSRAADEAKEIEADNRNQGRERGDLSAPKLAETDPGMVHEVCRGSASGLAGGGSASGRRRYADDLSLG